MLKWAFIFLVVAIIAAFLGFGGIAGTAGGIAQVLFWLFIVTCIVLFAAAVFAGKKVSR